MISFSHLLVATVILVILLPVVLTTTAPTHGREATIKDEEQQPKHQQQTQTQTLEENTPEPGEYGRIMEVISMHHFHFSEDGRPLYCEPIGEIVFHDEKKNETPKKGEITLKPEAAATEWSVTLTQIVWRGRRYRSLYTNFVLEAIVECLPSDADAAGCIRADPPCGMGYIDALLAGSLIGEALRENRTASTKTECRVRMLLGGLGTAIIPTFFRKLMPDYCLDIVELLPAIIETTTTDLGFDVSDDPRFRIINSEFFEYLTTTSQSYDIILVDISGQDGKGGRVLPPPALSTLPVIRAMFDRLNDHGVLVQHLWNTVYSQGIFHQYRRNLAKVFPEMSFLDAQQSWVVVAPKRTQHLDGPEVATKVGKILKERNGGSPIDAEITRIINLLNTSWRTVPNTEDTTIEHSDL